MESTERLYLNRLSRYLQTLSKQYWLTSSVFTDMVLRILKKGLCECGDYNNEARGLYLKCNIVVHNKDAKFLAVRLAQLEKSPSILFPSDSQALLQGQYGMYWEEGRSWYYVGEDWVATSTGVLMNYIICKNALNLDFSALNCTKNQDTRRVDDADEDF